MKTDFSPLKKFTAQGYKVLEANDVFVIRHVPTGRMYRVEKTWEDFTLQVRDVRFSDKWEMIYRAPDLYRLLRLVGFSPLYNRELAKNGEFTNAVDKIQNA